MIETYYRILKHNPEGKLVKDTGLVPSSSYVIQFLELIEALLNTDATKTATDVDGNENIIYNNALKENEIGRVKAPAGEDAYGIVIGINTTPTAVDNENYKLDDKILHSVTEEADKMNYQAVTMLAPAEAVGNIDFDITRTFLNESGGTITVKEIGIICENSSDGYYHLLLRDVVTDEDVLDDYTLTVVYTLRTTV